MTDLNKQSAVYFPNLDGLRFVAFLLVFVNHAASTLGFQTSNTLVNDIRTKFLLVGDLGVNFFFVLSGFLITYLLLKEKEQNSKINIRFFYLRRVLRIWPLYFLVLFICFVIIPFFSSSLPVNFPVSASNVILDKGLYLFFLGNFDYLIHGISNYVVGVLWSVSIEEQFYLFWPLLLIVFPRKHLVKVFIALILFSTLYRLFGTSGLTLNLMLKYHTFSCISDLSVGALFAQLCTNEKTLESFVNIKKHWIDLFYIAGLLLIVFRFDIYSLEPVNALDPRQSSHILKSIMPVVYSFFFAFILIEQVFAKNSIFKIGRIPFISKLGKISYGLYCYHMIAMFLVVYVFFKLGYNAIHPSATLLFIEAITAFILTIIISSISYTYFEKRFLLLKEKFSIRNNIQQAESPIKKKSLFLGISIAAILISFFYSYNLKWLGDDIFIGFRYVQNFISENGLVYNIGERVEGCTDFLWIMLISFFSWLKCNPLITVQTLGIISSLGTLILFSIIVYKISAKKDIFILPFVTIALALNYDYNVWATSGLETAFFCFLLSSTFYIYFFSSFEGIKKLFFSGFLLCLALLTRPDTLIILVTANGLLFFDQLINRIKFSKILSSLFFFNLAIICIYIPYFLWKFNYYGFIFPNTYYVKLGNESMFSKGFYYIGLYFEAYFTSFLFLILPFLVLFPLLKKNFIPAFKEFTSDKFNSAFAASTIIVYVYLIGFVAKVGGDFMFARFIIPIVPFIYFVIFYSIQKIVKVNYLNVLLFVLLVAGFFETKIRTNLFLEKDEYGQEKGVYKKDVVDERYVYTSYYKIEDEIKLGQAINNCFKGIDAKILIRGGQACMGYYANFNYTQEFHGLTDTLIAHSVIKTRGRIGHEKHGTMEYFQNKGIDFMFARSQLTKDSFRIATLNIPPYAIGTEIITYNANIIKQLKEKLGGNFIFTDFQEYLDDYIKNTLPAVSSAKLKSDYDNFYLYYFKHNADKIREDQFIAALNKRRA